MPQPTEFDLAAQSIVHHFPAAADKTTPQKKGWVRLKRFLRRARLILF